MEKEERVPPTTNTALSGISNRRGFLEGLGFLGLAALTGTAGAEAHENQIDAPSTPRLSSIGKVEVLRDEKFDIPGGKEHIMQYTVTDDKGVTERRFSSTARTEGSDQTYTVITNHRIEQFAAGQSLKGPATSTKAFQINVYGVKGYEMGDRRNDTITTTIIGPDGSVHRQTQVVPVRLDMSEFTGLSTAELITKVGNAHFAKQVNPLPDQRSRSS